MIGVRTIFCFVVAICLFLYVFKKRSAGKAVNAFPVVALLLTLAVTGVFEARWIILQDKGSKAIVEASGNPQGHLRCQRLTNKTMMSFSEPLRHAEYKNPNRAILDYDTCKTLFSWVTDDKNDPSDEQIVAVHRLTHEALHVAGDFIESSAECKAMQRDVLTVRALSGDTVQGRTLARRYYEQFYTQMPDEYVDSGCRQGGLLDFSPDDGFFP